MSASPPELWIQGAGVVVAAAGLYYLARQVKKAADANRTSNVMLILTLEQTVSANREKLATAAVKMKDAADRKSPDAEIETARLAYEERIEEYLNSVDRLCACIVRKYVDEEEYRKDYRNGIMDIVKQHKNKLGPDTRHRNILKVHAAWSEDKSATG